jgi:hypothetical protein
MTNTNMTLKAKSMKRPTTNKKKVNDGEKKEGNPSDNH